MDRLLAALRDLGKAYKRLSRAVPDPVAAEAEADAALQRVLVLLADPEITRALAELIPPARERLVNHEPFGAELETIRSELVEFETKVMRRLGATESDIVRLYDSYRLVRDRREAFLQGVDALKRRLEEVHHAAKAAIRASRGVGRKEKKKRKRRIGQGVASAILGTGVIAANTQLPLMFAFSYGLGGGALHQALRDLVGEAPD